MVAEYDFWERWCRDGSRNDDEVVSRLLETDGEQSTPVLIRITTSTVSARIGSSTRGSKHATQSDPSPMAVPGLTRSARVVVWMRCKRGNMSRRLEPR
jgi:hypothetical protein